jgi:hypothetical protein
MKRIIFFYLFVTAAVFAQFQGPKITSKEKEYDFGKIKEGEIVTHSFTVYNSGSEELVIGRVKASCGCTAADPIKTSLSPGDSTSIEVKFNSIRRRGPQRKYVYIFSNDPAMPQLRLVFTAFVEEKGSNHSSLNPTLKMSSYNHNFGKVSEGEKLDLTIEITNTGKSELRIKDVKSSCGCTAALLSSKLLKPDEKGKLKIEFDTTNLAGQIARTVTLFSNDPEHPTRVLTLFANIEKG